MRLIESGPAEVSGAGQRRAEPEAPGQQSTVGPSAPGIARRDSNIQAENEEQAAVLERIVWALAKGAIAAALRDVGDQE